MKRVIDFHTHAFPEKIVERAIQTLEQNSGEKAFHDGRVRSLLASMDRAGIAVAVIANIATKPDQFESILGWSRAIRSDKILPFLSVHPNDAAACEHVRIIKAEGFQGVKLHPYYQGFALDEERLFPIYEEIAKQGLILLSHTGFDAAFPRERICDPAKIKVVTERFPELVFVASHCGAWHDWDEVEKHLVGTRVYMELSFSVQALPEARVRAMLRAHPSEFVLFGTDSPWTDQKETVEGITRLALPEALEEAILFNNAARLLGV